METFVALARRARLLAIVCIGAIIFFQSGVGISAFADEVRYTATTGQALIILKSTDINDMHETIAALNDAGIHPMHIIPPRVVIADMPAGEEQNALAISNVASVHKSAVTPFAATEGMDLASGIAAWNHLVSRQVAAPAGMPQGATPLIGDAFEPPISETPQLSARPELQQAPGPTSTSEFMIGKVAVGVILPESNGSGENWSIARQQEVFDKIVAGLNWWATKGGSAAHLTFYYDQKFSVPTSYEPITRNGWSDENVWVTDIFQNMGYTSGDNFARAQAYINNLRTTYNTDWCYTFIVVDSLNDADGTFTSGYFAWAYLGGPYSIMTYDNDGWGISNMNSVASHETGHIFLAGDEYCSPGYACCDFGYYGYLNVYNGNCEDGNPSSVNCMMKNNYDAICTYTNGQIGWRDTDGDGRPDPIDNVVNNTLNYYPTPTMQTILTFTGTATDVPYNSPTRPDVTINNITSVDYRIDGGSWTNASAVDGSFDEDVEGYTFTTPSLGYGVHLIETQAYSSSGNVSAIAGQNVEITTTGEIIIGTGTRTWTYPLATSYDDARTQSIYLASEIGAYTITALALDVTQVPGQTMSNFTIRMKHTDLSIYGGSPNWESSGWTTVYQTNQSVTTTGWAQFNFTAPFAYNGVQNLMVDISFNNSSRTTDGRCRRSVPGGTRSIYYRTNSGYGDPLSWSDRTPAPDTSTNIPNVKLFVTSVGSLHVTISPQGAIDAGAQWRRTGTSTWWNSGDTESGISAGQHTVEFKDIPGWNKPSNQDVTISEGQTTNASGTYTIPGSLYVTISPQGAVDAGAQWRRTGTSTWWNNGDTESGIPAGQYTVEFKDIPGWRKPSNQGVTISEGQTTNASGTYVLPVIYADVNATGADNGLSWADAYTSLQSALSAAVSGDEIWVAKGRYRPTTNTDRTVSFVMKQSVAIYGGFAGTEMSRNQRDWVANQTILSGDIGIQGDNSDNSYHVVVGVSDSVLNGFTITGGNANGSAYSEKVGGGMYNNSSSPTVTNCTFSGNSADYYGGGMYNYNSNPRVTNCTFSENSAIEGGGGMYNYYNSSPTVTNCTFSGNSADYYGGGMDNEWNSGLTVTNCTFIGNMSLNGTILACGSWEQQYPSSVTMANCIIWNGPNWLWNNDNSNITISYSDVEGGWEDTGNIDTDPCFVDPNGPDGIAGTEDDNLRLLSSSPCIDAGNNDSVPPDYTDLDGDANATEPTPLDIDGLARFIDGDCNDSNIVDMGAYEFYFVGDLNNNCNVNFIDFALFALGWLETDCEVSNNWCDGADFTRDGQVEWADLRQFVEWWLAGIE